MLAEDPDELRAAAGLSHAKVAVPALAGRARARRVAASSDALAGLPDDEVIAELTAVTGIGQWSADMFLMFHLQRPDVLPVGDLGIRKAFQAAYGLPELPGRAEMERIAEPWRPYRTAWRRPFLWHSLSATPL